MGDYHTTAPNAQDVARACVTICASPQLSRNCGNGEVAARFDALQTPECLQANFGERIHALGSAEVFDFIGITSHDFHLFIRVELALLTPVKPLRLRVTHN
jgi:hypothetical protein